jgi:hypothetical protein
MRSSWLLLTGAGSQLSSQSRIEAIAWAKLDGGGGFLFPWELSALVRTLRVFTILSSKNVTISLEIKLSTTANLSNGKGDNSIVMENNGKLCPDRTANTIFLFLCPSARIRSEHK